MTDRPIIFSAPMVRAIIEGRKTMTRRFAWRDAEKSASTPVRSHWQRAVPGDLLWVRETFAVQSELWKQSHGVQPVEFKADIKYREEIEDYTLKPSIHMPRWASRLTLEVTSVKIERLEGITEADAVSEGIERLRSGRGYYDPRFGHGLVRTGHHLDNARDAFIVLWDHIYGEDAWAETKVQEVVVLTFTVHQQNIDAFKRERQAA